MASMNKISTYKSGHLLGLNSKYGTVSKEVLFSMVNSPLKGVPQTKPVVISTGIHRDLAHISNLNGASPSEKVNLTS